MTFLMALLLISAFTGLAQSLLVNMPLYCCKDYPTTSSLNQKWVCLGFYKEKKKTT